MARNTTIPPQSIDSERALLGALMLKPNAIYDIADLLVPDAFYATKHGTIFSAMLSLFQKGDPIDLVTLSAMLESKAQLENVGGRAYLAELINAAPTAAHLATYAEVIKAKHVLRGLLDAATQIHELGFAEDREIEKVLDEAQQTVFRLANNASIQKFVAIRDELSEAWKRIEALQEHTDTLRGIRTGFTALDNLLAGLQKSDLIILAARPSMGKTSLALDIARQASVMHKHAVGIFSLEMSSQQLTDRMLAAEAKVNSWRLRTGKLRGDDEYERIRNAMDRLSEAPIYIDDKAERTVLQMRSIARRLKTEKGLSLVIIDYLQLIMPGNHRSDSMVQQVTEISRSLKAMARELDVPVLALSQLSRAVEQRRDRPRLSDLRDSGSIEQDADVVMFIHREDKMKGDEESTRKNIADILIEKHRNGPVGKIELYFDEEKASFLSVDKSDFGDFETPKKAENDDEF